MVEASVSVVGYFMPIFAFLLVFIVIYSLLKATKVLGESQAVMFFVSLILSSFFVVEASLVDFVRYSSSWLVVGIFIVFFIILIVGFVPGIKVGEFFGKNNWFALVLLILVVAVFIISAAYVFNWVIDWDVVRGWVGTEWFGFILLLVIAGVVSWKIK